MSVGHLHLMLNHFPVIGAVFCVLLLALAVWRNSSELGKVSFGALALVGAASIVVFLTGEPAEELIENLPGFSDAITERHEDVALIATIAMGIVGALALAVLAVLRRRALPRSIIAAGLVASVGVGALMGYTGFLGGQVRHTEIRPGAVAAVEDEHSGPSAEREGRDEH